MINAARLLLFLISRLFPHPAGSPSLLHNGQHITNTHSLTGQPAEGCAIHLHDRWREDHVPGSTGSWSLLHRLLV